MLSLSQLINYISVNTVWTYQRKVLYPPICLHNIEKHYFGKMEIKISFQFSIAWKIIRVTAYHSFKYIHNSQILVSSFSGSRRCSWTEWTGWFPWCHRMNMFQLFSSFPFWSEFDFSKYNSYVQLWLIFHWFSVGLCTGSPWPHRKPRCRRSRRWKGEYWFNNNAT